MLFKVINYAFRSIYIVLGILFLSGVLFLETVDPELQKVFGGIAILFGLYRISTYRTAIQRDERIRNLENED